jgi:hypothetical protein
MQNSILQKSTQDAAKQGLQGRRSRTVVILGTLLIVETLVLAFSGLLHLLTANKVLSAPAGLVLFLQELSTRDGVVHIPFGIIFLPLALLSLFATIGFFRVWRVAWVTAMSVQGLSLLMTLILYFDERPKYIYVIMIYCIFLVAYLHHSDVKKRFRPRELQFPGEWKEE